MSTTRPATAISPPIPTMMSHGAARRNWLPSEGPMITADGDVAAISTRYVPLLFAWKPTALTYIQEPLVMVSPPSVDQVATRAASGPRTWTCCDVSVGGLEWEYEKPGPDTWEPTC